jgi:8-oxo-dGTP pyrophosphatase MutT (NUDIX family)
MSVATHKGQISFPGGMREDQDATFEDTALRETREELGIEPGMVEVLGEFNEYQAVTNQRVRTFVGIVPPDVRIEPQQTEVAYVLEVPFQFFLTTEPRVEQKFRLGRMHDIYFYDFGDETIWGLTARMIKDFLEEVG